MTKEKKIPSREKRRLREKARRDKAKKEDIKERIAEANKKRAREPDRKRKQSKRANTCNGASINFETIDLPDEDMTRNAFESFEKYPDVAVMLHHVNSGNARFKDIRNLHYPDAKEAIMKEIAAEMLSQDEKNKLRQDFITQEGQTCSLPTCGACGCREYERGTCTFRKRPVPELTTLQLSGDELTSYLEIKLQHPIELPTSDDESGYFDVWRLYSRFHDEDTNDVYYLHPEMVHEENGIFYTQLCNRCDRSIKKNEIPTNSIADGKDFGCYRRIGLTPLNVTERAMLARVRLFNVVIKLVENNNGRSNYTRSKLCGHAIAFPHDSPSVVADMFSKERMKDLLSVYFMCSDGKKDPLMYNAFRSNKIAGRAYVLYQWFQVLFLVNPIYSDLTKELPPFDTWKDMVGEVNEHMRKNAEFVHDEQVLATELNQGDDIAKVRTTTDPSYVQNMQAQMDESDDNDNDDDMVIETCAVLNRTPDQSLKEAQKSVLEGARQAFETPDSGSGAGRPNESQGTDTSNDNGSSAANVSRRSDDPVNEFTEAEVALVYAFPDVFMFGRAYDRDVGTLNSTETHHLLRQFTNVPAQRPELCYYLTDQANRHAVVQGISSFVKGNPEIVKQFHDLQSNPNWLSILHAAQENPETREAKQIVNTIMRVLHLSARKCLWSPIGRDQSLSKIYGLVRRYGPPGIFLTIAPNDIDNPSILRLSFWSSSNQDFPAQVDDSYIETLRDNGTLLGSGNIPIPASHAARVRATCENPVASVLEYRSLVHNILTVLLKVDVQHSRRADTNSTKKTRYYRGPDSKGIFGHLLSYYGVHETQLRGALHIHLLLFGSIDTEVLEYISSFKDICAEAAKVLESMYCAELPREIHVRDIIRKKMEYEARAPHVAIMLRERPDINDEEGWIQHSHKAASSVNIHEHCMTCHKGKMGKTGCRTCYNQGLSPQTGPTQLMVDRIEGSKNATIRVQAMEGIEPRRNPNDRNISKEPVPFTDTRVIAWEIKRPELKGLDVFVPGLLGGEGNDKERLIHRLKEALGPDTSDCSDIIEWLPKQTAETLLQLYNKLATELPNRNGAVCDHNQMMSSLCGCNTAAYHLGTREQAAAATQYCGPYMQKEITSGNKMERSAAILFQTADRVAELEAQGKGSVADDKDEPVRKVKYYLSKAMNNINKQSELNNLQAVAVLLKMESEVLPDSFCYCASKHAINYRKHEKMLLLSADSNDDCESVGNYDYEDSDFIVDDRERYQVEEKDDAESPQESVARFSDGDEIELESDDETTDTLVFDGPEHFTENDFGRAKVYTVDDGKRREAVVKPQNFRFRGPALAHLTLQEYECTIGIRDLDNETSVGPGRKASATFPFDEGHPLHASHVQYVLSKQHTLILIGAIPRHPGPCPEDNEAEAVKATWLNEANAFAEHVLTLYRPEENYYAKDQVNALRYDWDAFAKYMAFLEASPRLIHQMRFRAIQKSTYCMHTKSSTKLALMKWRARNRTIWSKNEKEAADSWFAMYRMKDGKDDDGIASLQDNLLMQQLSGSKSLNAHFKRVKYSRAQESSITSIFGTVTNDEDEVVIGVDGCSTQDNRKPAARLRTDVGAFEPAEVAIRSSEIKKAKDNRPGQDVYTDDTHGGPTVATSQASLISRVREHFAQVGQVDDRSPVQPEPLNDILSGLSENESKKFIEKAQSLAREMSVGCVCTINDGKGLRLVMLTEEQQLILNDVKNHFTVLGPVNNRQDPPPVGPFRLITGLPGTGKSTVVEYVRQMSRKMDVGSVIVSAFTGIASVNIGGVTVSTQFGPVQKRGSVRTLDNTDFLNLVERFDGSKLCLVIIDEISTIDPMFVHLIDQRLRQITGRQDLRFGGCGVYTFGDFFQLPPVLGVAIADGSVRYAKSLKGIRGHKYDELSLDKKKGVETFITARRFQLTTQQRSVDPDHSEFIANVVTRGRVSLGDLLPYKTLTKQDIEKDPSWAFAPIIVATNRERMDIIASQARRFAKQNNTLVVRWRTKKWKLDGLSETAIKKILEDPVLYEHFVVGAMGFIATNICNGLGLVNGLEIKYHSLTFQDEVQKKEYRSKMRNARAGDVITLDMPPRSVNVLVKPKFKSSAWEKVSLKTDKEVIVPLDPVRQEKNGDTHSVSTEGTPIRLKSVPYFDVDMAFSITDYKGQGRTLDKVIVALSNRPSKNMSLSSVYVDLSRTRKAENIRILLHDGDRVKELGYISSLRFPSFIPEFLSGYNEAGFWCPERALADPEEDTARPIGRNLYRRNR